MRVAVVDVGATAVRSVVAEMTSRGPVRRYDRTVEIRVDRIARGPDPLAAGTVELLRDCIRRFRDAHDRLEVTEVRLHVGLARRQALRAAGLLDWMADTLGAAVLSDGGEPVALVAAATASGALDGRPTLLVELAADGANVAVTKHGDLVRGARLPLPDLARLAPVARPDDPRRWIGVAAAAAQPLAAPAGTPTMMPIVAAGPTVRELAAHAASHAWHEPLRVSHRVALEGEELAELAHALARDDAPLTHRRATAAALAGTAVVLAGLAATTSSSTIVTTDAEAIDAHVTTLLPPGPASTLGARVLEAAGHVPTPHAEQVARLCLALFDDLAPRFGITPTDREILAAAALVHDMTSEDGPGHHRRAGQAVLEWPARGVDAATLVEIASLVRAQRGRPPGPHFPPFLRLPPTRRAAVERLVALLRLGDGLDRGHEDAVQGLHADHGDGVVFLDLHGDRLDLALYGAREHLRYAERTLGTRIVLRAVQPSSLSG
jgi:exopolyphosphatase/pppGpp-phosphohydrolase